ncbi:MAG: glycoside hydrolase family 3 N-terminal domain-containing protein [Candidatus Gottesmanbacteria bacterium]
MAKKHNLFYLLFFFFFCIVSFILIRTIVYHRQSDLATSVPQAQTLPLLSNEETVGQLFVWGIPGTTLSSDSAELIANTHPAGVILMGEFTQDELRKITDEIRQIPMKVPLFIAIDGEGGTVTHLKEDKLPGGKILGFLNDDDFCQIIASRSALLLANGINTNFGIIGDIGWNNQTYMNARAYSNRPEDVAHKVSLAIQCSTVISAVKHFPGHGDSSINSHYRIPTIMKDEKTWKLEDGLPFLNAIENSADMIMIGHIRYTKIASEPASLSKKFHDVLKENKFQGLVITDDLGMLEQSGYKPDAAVRQAIEAGNDLLLITTSTTSPEELYTNFLKEAMQSPTLMQTIQNRVNTTLRFKSKHFSF